MPDPESPSECCSGIKHRLASWTVCAEKAAREEPVKTAAYTFVAGLILAVFPIGRLAGALVRLFLALVRPALLVLGLVKIFDELERRRR